MKSFSFQRFDWGECFWDLFSDCVHSFLDTFGVGGFDC